MKTVIINHTGITWEEGSQPVWFFANPCVNSSSLSSGEIPERWHCEMLLKQKTGLTQFVILELEITESAVKTGKTHNAYQYAKVAGRLDIKSLCAVYYVGLNGGLWALSGTLLERGIAEWKKDLSGYTQN